MTEDFSLEKMQVREQYSNIFRALKKKLNPQSIPRENTFKKRRWNKEYFKHTQRIHHHTSRNIKEIIQEEKHAKWIYGSTHKKSEDHKKW